MQTDVFSSPFSFKRFEMLNYPINEAISSLNCKTFNPIKGDEMLTDFSYLASSLNSQLRHDMVDYSILYILFFFVR